MLKIINNLSTGIIEVSNLLALSDHLELDTDQYGYYYTSGYVIYNDQTINDSNPVTEIQIGFSDVQLSSSGNSVVIVSYSLSLNGGTTWGSYITCDSSDGTTWYFSSGISGKSFASAKIRVKVTLQDGGSNTPYASAPMTIYLQEVSSPANITSVKAISNASAKVPCVDANELVVNGHFSNALTGWTTSPGTGRTFAVVNGQFNLTVSSGETWVPLVQNISATPNTSYIASVGTNTGMVYIQEFLGTTVVTNFVNGWNSGETGTITFTTSSGIDTIRIVVTNRDYGNGTYIFDDISLKRDNSVSANINVSSNIATLRPSSTIDNGYSIVPDGTVHGVLSDDNPNTYINVFNDATGIMEAVYNGYLSGWNVTSQVAVSSLTVTMIAGYSGSSVPTYQYGFFNSYFGSTYNFTTKSINTYTQTFTKNPNSGQPWINIGNLIFGIMVDAQVGVGVNIYEVTLTVSYSSASSKALAPTIGIIGNVTSVKATSTSSAIVPVVSVIGNVTSVKSTSNSSVIIPIVSGTGNITSVKSTSNSSAIVPTVKYDYAITSVKASATSSLITPTLKLNSIIGAIKSTSNAIALIPYINLFKRIIMTDLTMETQYKTEINTDLNYLAEMRCQKAYAVEMIIVRQYQS